MCGYAPLPRYITEERSSSTIVISATNFVTLFSFTRTKTRTRRIRSYVSPALNLNHRLRTIKHRRPLVRSTISMNVRTSHHTSHIRIFKRLPTVRHINRYRHSSCITIRTSHPPLLTRVARFVNRFTLVGRGLVSTSNLQIRDGLLGRVGRRLTRPTRQVGFILTFANPNRFVRQLLRNVRRNLRRVHLITRVPVSNPTHRTNRQNGVNRHHTHRTPFGGNFLNHFRCLTPNFLDFLFNAAGRNDAASVEVPRQYLGVH